MFRSGNHLVLVQTLLAHTPHYDLEDSDRSIFANWRLDSMDVDKKRKGVCACGKEGLRDIYYIRHIENGTVLTIGSVCVKKFFMRTGIARDIDSVKKINKARARNAEKKVCDDCYMVVCKCDERTAFECQYCKKVVGLHAKSHHMKTEHLEAYYGQKKLTFGKYKGRLILDIMQKDRAYLEWAIENCLEVGYYHSKTLDIIKDLVRDY